MINKGEEAYTHNLYSVSFSHSTQKNALLFIKSLKNSYSFHIRDFIRYLETTGQDITVESIRSYIIDLNHNPAYAASTKRVKRQAVKKVLKKLLLKTNKAGDFQTALKLNFVLKILDEDEETKAPKINTPAVGKDRIITKKDFETLITGARSEKQKRFIEVLFYTGLRVSEMLKIQKHHIFPQKKVVRVRIMGKKRKERFILLSGALYEAVVKTFWGNMGNYSSGPGKIDFRPLFATSTGKFYCRSYVSGQIKKLGRHILDKNISAHTLRHSFATLKIKETGKIKGVSQYLGHSTPAITLQMYVHESLELEELF